MRVQVQVQKPVQVQIDMQKREQVLGENLRSNRQLPPSGLRRRVHLEMVLPRQVQVLALIRITSVSEKATLCQLEVCRPVVI